MNPAAATKAFLIASWAGVMAKPATDATSSASGTTEVVVSLVDKIVAIYEFGYTFKRMFLLKYQNAMVVMLIIMGKASG